MAIQKPYNINLRGKTFDANNPIEVTWQVSGDMQVAYKIDILMNVDNTQVWTTNKVNSYSLKHIIPSETLDNGEEYKIIVTIWNESNEYISSDNQVFQTSSTPIVTVSPIGTVENNNYTFSATYSQDENVEMSHYVVILYNSNKQIISKSSIKTASPIEHMFTNLQSETTYYIEFQVTSKKGLIGTSGLVEFDVLYTIPKIALNLEAENIANGGIGLSWHVVQIIGETDSATFIDNEKVDTTNGAKVWFDEGFSIDDDFTLKVWLENVPSKKDLIILKGINGELKLQYDAVLEMFILKRNTTPTLSEHWTSEIVTGSSFFILIQQIGNQINLKAEVLN